MKTKLDEILAYCEKATKGPWSVSCQPGFVTMYQIVDAQESVEEMEANRRLMEKARTDLPLVVEYAKKLETENADLWLAMKASIAESEYFQEELALVRAKLEGK